MKKHSLKTHLSLVIAAIVLFTVGLAGVLSNALLHRQFVFYKSEQSTLTMQKIADDLAMQYKNESNTFNSDFVHVIGMAALGNGYLIHLTDTNGQVVWDAKQCDMTSCTMVMNNIAAIMKQAGGANSQLTTAVLPVKSAGAQVGTVEITSYGPYFYSQSDFQYLRALNGSLLITAAVCVLVSVLIGFFIAGRISRPIAKTAATAMRIAEGDYSPQQQSKTTVLEVDELTASVGHLSAVLGEQENLRRQLSSDVAHELRTPITAVSAQLEAMTMGIWEPTPERLTGCLEEVQRIGRLIADLEKLSILENEAFTLEKSLINLRTLTEKTVFVLENEIIKKRLRVSVNGSCEDIFADKDRFGQVLLNLLSNAVKYTPDGGRVDILLDEDKQSVFIRIKDTGIGISNEDLPHIFERFYRADKSRNRLTGGVGIGLAVVKAIVQAHGGTITEQSKENEGTEFTVKLPK